MRIHLTAEDLLNTRFARQPAPLIETGFAVAMLQRRDPVFRNWRRSAATRLPAPIGLLMELIPPSACGPVFLEPTTVDLAEGLDRVQAVPAAFAAAELLRVTSPAPPTPLRRQLAAQDRETWQELDLALRLAHRCLVEGAWERIMSGFRAELAWRSRLIAELGLRAALSTLHPRLRWNGTVLNIEGGSDIDVHPGGAGLILLPSPLWTGWPTITAHPDELPTFMSTLSGDQQTGQPGLRHPLILTYPATAPLPLIEPPAPDPLAGLLGSTRAHVLQLAATEHTTTQLARALKVSAATISGHTKALRAAGLITSTRAGKSVLHALTPLGARLLTSTAGRPSLTPPAHAPVTGPPDSECALEYGHDSRHHLTG